MSDEQTTLGAFDDGDTADTTDGGETADDLRERVERNAETIDTLAGIIGRVSGDVSALEEVATLALDSGETDAAEPDTDIDPNDARMFR